MKKISLLFCFLISLSLYAQNTGGVSMTPPLALMGRQR
jgi:hypothetical protein